MHTSFPPNNVTYRPGTPDDSYTAFTIFEHTLADLLKRMGSRNPTSAADPEAMEHMWQERQSLYNHLAQTADQYWIAERSGEVIGFSRSILRAGFRELTELFVLPDQQSGGVGRELMARAFPPEENIHHSIIATTDLRAQRLYLKSGVIPRFSIYYLGRKPAATSLKTDITFKAVGGTRETLESIAGLDQALLGHRRDADHTWLHSDRQGYLYLRNGQPVGYGYVGHRSGPFALLDTEDFPAVLAHAENQSFAGGHSEFGLEVPTVNQSALNYLQARGFRLDPFVAIMMTDRPAGRFEHYILTSPPFFM